MKIPKTQSPKPQPPRDSDLVCLGEGSIICIFNKHFEKHFFDYHLSRGDTSIQNDLILSAKQKFIPG